MIFREKLVQLRKSRNLTQEQLAEALGVSRQAVSRWESSGSYPDMEMIPAIANYFHVSIDELFGYHDDREEKIKIILEKADKTLSKVLDVEIVRASPLAEMLSFLTSKV